MFKLNNYSIISSWKRNETFTFISSGSNLLMSSAERVGLRCPLPDGCPWTPCGRGGGHLQGQTDSSHVQPPRYSTGTISNLIAVRRIVLNCVLACWIVHVRPFSRLWSMSCFTHLVSLNISSTPGQTVPPLLQVFKHILIFSSHRIKLLWNCGIA